MLNVAIIERFQFEWTHPSPCMPIPFDPAARRKASRNQCRTSVGCWRQGGGISLWYALIFLAYAESKGIGMGKL